MTVSRKEHKQVQAYTDLEQVGTRAGSMSGGTHLSPPPFKMLEHQDFVSFLFHSHFLLFFVMYTTSIQYTVGNKTLTMFNTLERTCLLLRKEIL